MVALHKDDPGSGDVHVDGAEWGSGKKKPKAPGVGVVALEPDAVRAIGGIGKSEPQSLYIRRDVANADELITWAKAQGFKTVVAPETMHTTVLYSKSPVDWIAAGESWTCDPDGGLTVRPGGPRLISEFGNDPTQRCAVLQFASNDLFWRNAQLLEMGATSDFPEFQPHITLTWDIGDLDLSKVEPYQGKIELGPEIFEAINPDWRSTLVEKFATYCKVAHTDLKHGLVFGWAIVCKDENGADYYDVQKNHVPEDAMLDASTDFAKRATSPAGDMHVRMGAGTYPFMMPMTSDIAKAFGITTKQTGLMVGCFPDPALLAKFASGEYTGFSIGGEHIEINGKPVGDA